MKIYMKAILAVVFICGIFQSAHAQTACPIGVAPGSPQCGPSPASHQSTPSTQAAPETRSYPTGRWISMWGAIAIDNKVGDLGAVSNRPSKAEAEREAKIKCESNGATECVILAVNANNCSVVAWPSAPGGKIVAMAEKTIQDASRIALNKCASTSNAKCEIVYSGCSNQYFEEY